MTIDDFGASHPSAHTALQRNPAKDRMLWFLDDGSYNEARGLARFVDRLAPVTLRALAGDRVLAAQHELGWIAAIHTPGGRLSIELMDRSAALPALLRLADYLDDGRLVIRSVVLIRRQPDGARAARTLSPPAALHAVRQLAITRALIAASPATAATHTL